MSVPHTPDQHTYLLYLSVNDLRHTKTTFTSPEFKIYFGKSVRFH